MALTKTVTKIMPTKNQIGVHLLLQDDSHPITAGTVVVIDEDVTDNYSNEPTVENRAKRLVRFPTFENNFALVYLLISLVTS